MPTWAISLFGILCTVTGALFGFLLAQDRRITRLEERIRSLGQQLVALPKRKGD